jgi:hypothetical protein
VRGSEANGGQISIANAQETAEVCSREPGAGTHQTTPGSRRARNLEDGDEGSSSIARSWRRSAVDQFGGFPPRGPPNVRGDRDWGKGGWEGGGGIEPRLTRRKEFQLFARMMLV